MNNTFDFVWLTREEFEPARIILEASRKKTRPREHDLYTVFNAILYRMETGSTWRELPSEFPPWRSVHEYFTQWSFVRGGDGSTCLDLAIRAVGKEKLLERIASLSQRHGSAPASPAAPRRLKGP